MKFFRSFFAAFSMYSNIPVPSVEWTKDTMAWALCFFPLVGAVIGGVMFLWLRAAQLFAVDSVLRGAVALAIPILVSGGIHLDGFCDTSDALASNLSRERRLEILKDSHTGAFAIICCVLYLIIFFAAWCSVTLDDSVIFILCLVPVLSRSLSGFAAVTLPNARGSGLLAAFTEHAHAKRARLIFLLWIALAAFLMLSVNLVLGAVSLLSAFAVSVYYFVMSRNKFGGITGDLEGYFLQLVELFLVLAAALFQNFSGAFGGIL